MNGQSRAIRAIARDYLEENRDSDGGFEPKKLAQQRAGESGHAPGSDEYLMIHDSFSRGLKQVIEKSMVNGRREFRALIAKRGRWNSPDRMAATQLAYLKGNYRAKAIGLLRSAAEMAAWENLRTLTEEHGVPYEVAEDRVWTEYDKQVAELEELLKA